MNVEVHLLVTLELASTLGQCTGRSLHALRSKINSKTFVIGTTWKIPKSPPLFGTSRYFLFN